MTAASGSKSLEAEPCLFDDVQGRGRLLGLEVVTDSILDPRRDRVIPLWVEEQGITIAIANPIFARVRTMVDLGAGSGVFALAAARHGCMALAVEASPRALEFLARNAARNSIPCRGPGQHIGRGEIGYLPCVIGADDRLLAQTVFQLGARGADLVMLNAPYHPTIPGIVPAVHARAGEFGQSAFSDFIAAAAVIVAPGGWIIGHQMSLVDSNGRLSVLPEIEAALRSNGKGGRLAWISCLADQIIDANHFLRAVYGGRDEHPNLDGYVRRVTEMCTGFSLISFRIRVTDTIEGFSARQVRNCHLWYGSERDWEDRIKIHRQIALSAGTQMI